MFEKINVKGIIVSFYIGMFISSSVELLFGQLDDVGTFILSVFGGGLVGLLIGVITEILTSLLPISMAKANIYYFINNIIALIATVVILGGYILCFDTIMSVEEIIRVMIFACIIVTSANGLGYVCYRRMNKKLQRYKKDYENKEKYEIK